MIQTITLNRTDDQGTETMTVTLNDDEVRVVSMVDGTVTDDDVAHSGYDSDLWLHDRLIDWRADGWTEVEPLPDQPDGIEDDSSDLPDPVAAAERVREYICQSGDGLYDVQDGAPLYARDLGALVRAVLAETAKA